MSSSRPTKRESPRARDTSSRVVAAPGADETVDAHRLGDALHAELAEILELEVAARRAPPSPRQIAGIGRRERLHALRKADGVALRRVVHAQVVADRADHDLARVDAHAGREADAVLALHLGRVARGAPSCRCSAAKQARWA